MTIVILLDIFYFNIIVEFILSRSIPHLRNIEIVAKSLEKEPQVPLIQIIVRITDTSVRLPPRYSLPDV